MTADLLIRLILIKLFKPLKWAALLFGMAFMLISCASLDKPVQTPQAIVSAVKVADAWQSQLPHGGDVAQLKDFWAQYNDALLLTFIADAQKSSPTISTATLRIAEARATRIANNASLLPTLDSVSTASRGLQQPVVENVDKGTFLQGIANSRQTNVQSTWELDLFGGNKALLAAAKKREQSSTSQWHAAQVSVAAELAAAYFEQRFCQMQTALYAADVASRENTVRVVEKLNQAGFSTRRDLHLAEAGAAQARAQVKLQQETCDIALKALVALTQWPEAALREKLNQQAFVAKADQTFFNIHQMPAEVIHQRPDIDLAESELYAFASELHYSKSQRLPKVSLNGSIGYAKLSQAGFESNGKVWSLGPISITLPIFDGGKRKANIESAEARYADAAVNYRHQVFVAVKEVESALITLDGTAMRDQEIQKAMQSYDVALNITTSRFAAGFANLLELEEERRSDLAIKTTHIDLLKARYNAWVSLYRAAGGGWARPVSTAKISQSSAVPATKPLTLQSNAQSSSY